MLLLVLILVLIAFSLLVVALLTGSVLWAWVSVGVSVAAALVLLIDFLQRRSAVRAGAAAGASRAGSLEPEAVTEVLPVVARPGSATDENSGKGSQQDAFSALPGQGADAQQTVVMPVVQPPASGDRPPGASHGTTPSGGDSSPTVTTAGADRSPSASPSGEASAGGVAPDGGSGGTVAAAPDKPADGEQPGLISSGAAAGAGNSGADGSAGATVVVQGTTGGAVPAQQTGPEGGSAGALTGAGAADPAPPAADGEPPEEPRDPAAVAVVAGLETEVLVIDEQPRYHVTGCRALVGKPLIPLPAREAVELGFTPCGWCTPDRTLAAQHATAR